MEWLQVFCKLSKILFTTTFLLRSKQSNEPVWHKLFCEPNYGPFLTRSYLHHFTIPSPTQKTTNPTCSSQPLPGKWLLPSYNLHHHCNMHMSWDHRQSPLEALLTHLRNAHKTHTWEKDMKSWHEGCLCHPKTQISWILCHLTTLCPKETMNNLMTNVKKLTLTIHYLNY